MPNRSRLAQPTFRTGSGEPDHPRSDARRLCNPMENRLPEAERRSEALSGWGSELYWCGAASGHEVGVSGPWGWEAWREIEQDLRRDVDG